MILQHWIEYPPDPRQLLLAWQAPPSAPVQDRLRWAVGRVTRTESGAVFDYLNEDEFNTLNLGRSAAALRHAGYAGYPAFDPKRPDADGFCEHVLEAFMRRLPPSGRADFASYLAHFHIRGDAKLSPFALLAITEARLPSDGFSLIDPLDPSADLIDIVIEIAGFRHLPERPVFPGQSLQLRAEPSNPNDPCAIQILASDHVVGYVNRLQAPAIGQWLEKRAISCWAARVHGRSSTPQAYAFLQVRPNEHRIAA